MDFTFYNSEFPELLWYWENLITAWLPASSMTIRVPQRPQEHSVLEPECHVVCRRRPLLDLSNWWQNQNVAPQNLTAGFKFRLSPLSSLTLGSCFHFSICPSSSNLQFQTPSTLFYPEKIDLHANVCSGLTLGSASRDGRIAEDRKQGPGVYSSSSLQ